MIQPQTGKPGVDQSLDSKTLPPRRSRGANFISTCGEEIFPIAKKLSATTKLSLCSWSEGLKDPGVCLFRRGTDYQLTLQLKTDDSLFGSAVNLSPQLESSLNSSLARFCDGWKCIVKEGILYESRDGQERTTELGCLTRTPGHVGLSLTISVKLVAGHQGFCDWLGRSCAIATAISDQFQAELTVARNRTLFLTPYQVTDLRGNNIDKAFSGLAAEHKHTTDAGLDSLVSQELAVARAKELVQFYVNSGLCSQWGVTPPRVIVVSGLPGSGREALANALRVDLMKTWGEGGTSQSIKIATLPNLTQEEIASQGLFGRLKWEVLVSSIRDEEESVWLLVHDSGFVLPGEIADIEEYRIRVESLNPERRASLLMSMLVNRLAGDKERLGQIDLKLLGAALERFSANDIAKFVVNALRTKALYQIQYGSDNEPRPIDTNFLLGLLKSAV